MAAEIRPDSIVAARKAAGMTLEDAARVCGVTRQTYKGREFSPREFRLGELADMYESMSDPARLLMRNAVAEIFLD